MNNKRKIWLTTLAILGCVLFLIQIGIPNLSEDGNIKTYSTAEISGEVFNEDGTPFNIPDTYIELLWSQNAPTESGENIENHTYKTKIENGKFIFEESGSPILFKADGEFRYRVILREKLGIGFLDITGALIQPELEDSFGYLDISGGTNIKLFVTKIVSDQFPESSICGSSDTICSITTEEGFRCRCCTEEACYPVLCPEEKEVKECKLEEPLQSQNEIESKKTENEEVELPDPPKEIL